VTAAPHALGFALRRLWPFWLIVMAGMIVGLLAGLASAILISMINKAIQVPASELATLTLTFLGLTAAVVVGEVAANRREYARRPRR